VLHPHAGLDHFAGPRIAIDAGLRLEGCADFHDATSSCSCGTSEHDTISSPNRPSLVANSTARLTALDRWHKLAWSAFIV
jgi:hypothetical protein